MKLFDISIMDWFGVVVLAVVLAGMVVLSI
jgi:hypothetical protein